MLTQVSCSSCCGHGIVDLARTVMLVIRFAVHSVDCNAPPNRLYHVLSELSHNTAFWSTAHVHCLESSEALLLDYMTVTVYHIRRKQSAVNCPETSMR